MGLGPVYGPHCQVPLVAIRRLAMTYLIRGSRLPSNWSATVWMSSPCDGSWVKSRAVTIPGPYQGLWSLSRVWWAASPMAPSAARLRSGKRASIWCRSVSRLFATRQVIAAS